MKPCDAPVQNGVIMSALPTRISQCEPAAWHGEVSQFSSSKPGIPGHAKKTAAAAAAAGVTKRTTQAPWSAGVDAEQDMPRSVTQASVAMEGSHAEVQPAELALLTSGTRY